LPVLNLNRIAAALPLPGGPKLSRVKPPTFSRQKHTYFPAKKTM